MTKIVIAGVAGRMGSEILQMALNDATLQVVGGFVEPGNPAVGHPIGPVKVTTDPSVISQGDVMIDFTVASAVATDLKACVSAKKAMVIGTTGLKEVDIQLIQQAAIQIPIVQSSNMSLGMNLIFWLSQLTAKYYKPLNIEITETHHRHKKDAPSGSALEIQKYIAKEWDKPIPIHSLRLGEVVGDHHVHMASWYEQIELVHRAQSRAPFAAGSLIAAKWVVSQKPGLYDMQDVLGLKA